MVAGSTVRLNCPQRLLVLVWDMPKMRVVDISTIRESVLRLLAPSKSSSGTSTDNGRQASVDVTEPATGREAVTRRLAAIVEESSSRAEELRLRLVIETAPVGLIITNDAGDVLDANLSALELFGVARREDVVGKALETCVAAEDGKALAGFVLRVCSGESGSLECQLVGSDGKRRRVEIRAVPLQRAATTAFLGVMGDVSEKHSATVLQEAQVRSEPLEA